MTTNLQTTLFERATMTPWLQVGKRLHQWPGYIKYRCGVSEAKALPIAHSQSLPLALGVVGLASLVGIRS